MRYSSSQKIAVIKEVVEGKHSVYSVCKKYSLSKMSFYKWLNIYKKARKNRHVSLGSSIKEGNDHYKSLSSSEKYKILAKVHNKPDLSCHQIARTLGLGNHAVQNLLEKENLNRLEQRVEYSKKPFWKRETAQRRQGMMELYEQGWQIDSICRHYKISKPTFFKWRQRYLEAKELGKLLSLSDRYIAGNVHHKYIDASVKDKVVEIVAHNPNWSVHKIAASVAQSGGKPVIGHHAIQNLLFTKDLNTIEKRQLYAQGYVRQLAPAIQIYDTPVPNLSVWRLLFAPFKTVPKWVLKRPATWPVIFPLTIFAAWIIEVDKLFNPVFLFPTIALTFGMFFFLYSLKYYFSLIMVMKVAQGAGGSTVPEAESGQGSQSIGTRIKNYCFNFIKISQPISRVNTLTLKLGDVELRARPFVSIHAPIYNEKRVVERLIGACSSQNWYDDVTGKANFEVVIIDDSTDDTTEIVKQKLAGDGRKLVRSVASEEMEVYISEVVNGPTIKLIHRFNRYGYKGAALGNAMNYIDPRAEYVAVFDADFVPYPDTIEQFMKSFQEACGGLEKVAESKIAAVQGYQWHVLNKSENWVTRGVRTEYAGSYVVERAGIGIYGGLNQIAGSVFCIRADVLKAFGWRTSITEDLQLTLRLYEQGYKVVFNPYIQAPAEAVSTVRRLIRQRMRWSEGHTFNVKQMWQKMMYSQRISGREKFEFMYLAPYYLQAAFFLIGVTAWFISEVVVHSRLPFWTAAWGWSLVFTNFLALPLMNLAGLFLEESEEKDYLGVASFMLLSYIVVPFQAYAAVKALFEKEEGPWFRTPKSGLITNDYNRGKFYGWVEKLKTLGGAGAVHPSSVRTSSSSFIVHGSDVAGSVGFGGRFNFARVTAHNPLSGYRIIPRRAPRVSRGVIAGLLIVILFINYLGFFAPQPAEAHHSGNHLEQQLNIMDTVGTTTSVVDTTPTPTDNSLGLVKYESGNYTSPTAYFEAVMKQAIATVGQYSSMVMDSNNYPVIAYYNSTNSDLDVEHCGSAACNDSHTITTVDGCLNTLCSGGVGSADVGKYTSIVLEPTNGYPVISYYDVSNANLRIVICGDANCSASNSYVSLDSTGDVGQYSQVVLDTTSATCTSTPKKCPVVAYYDLTNTDLKVVECTTNTCSSIGTPITVDGCATCNTNGSVGQYISMVKDASGFPVIAYQDVTNKKVKLVHCGDTKCTVASATYNNVSAAATTTTWDWISLKLDGSGFPVVAYHSVDNSRARLSHCADANCAAGTTSNDVTVGSGVYLNQKYLSMVLDASGYPNIGGVDTNTAAGVVIQVCADVNCSGNVSTIGYYGTNADTYTQLLMVSGNPQLIYANNTSKALMLLHCVAADCTESGSPTPVLTIDDGSGSGTALLYDSAGSAVSGGTVTNTATSYTRGRSSSVTLTDTSQYTVRYGLTSTNPRGTLSLDAARVIILQNPGAGNVTKTQATVEVGGTNGAITTIYTDIKGEFYCYDGNSSCGAAASPSAWNPAPTVYFEATLKNNTGGSKMYAQLYDITGAHALDGTGGYSASEVTVTGTTWALSRSAAITLTAGHKYKVQQKIDSGTVGTSANAHIILVQSDATSITNTEVVKTLNNAQTTGTTTSYVSGGYPNVHTQANFTGLSKTFYADYTMFYTACKSCSGTTGASQLNNSTGATTTTNTTATYNRASVSEPANAAELDIQNKIVSSDGTHNNNGSSLVIQISSLAVPEASLILLPLVFMLPYLVQRLRLRMQRKKLIYAEVRSG